MNFIMTAKPLAMIGCGHTLKDSTLGIQWHVLAMFGPSFVTGNLLARFGKIPITIEGILLLARAGAIALTGLSVAISWLGRTSVVERKGEYVSRCEAGPEIIENKK